MDDILEGFRPPVDGICRAINLVPVADELVPATQLRSAEDGRPGVLFGHFARFNEWTEINSSYEGRFLERVAPGSFAKTFKENRPRVLLEHGKHPMLGNAPIAAPTLLEEDGIGARYEAELVDGLPAMIVDGLRRGLYGASFRFKVTRQKLDERPARSEWNPDRLPERTISEVALHEFGPVTFPAYANATAGVRSMTDEMVALGLAQLSPEALIYAATLAGTAGTVDAALRAHLDPTAGDQDDDAAPRAHLADGERAQLLARALRLRASLI